MPNFARMLLKEEKGVLKEKKFSSVARVLRGQHSKIKSYVMITAENPYGEEHGKIENQHYNKKLEQDLKNRKLGFIKIRGKFGGNTEHSYIVMNANANTSRELGKKFGQHSIIYGEKQDVGDKREPQMVHQYIVGDKVTQTRKTFAQLARDIDDFYSTVKGRKFNIPFFDDEKRGLEFRGGQVVKVDNGTDVNEPEPEDDRAGEKEKHFGDKTKLFTPKGRTVWVKKDNEPLYLKKGYKQKSTKKVA